jgi:sugar (pentulose or hexulose) kinase
LPKKTMTKSIVLVDFGTSRIKAVQFSIKQNRVLNSREYASPTLSYGDAGEVEGNPEDYWRALEATAGQLIASAPEIEDIWLCSEMHGFLLVDYKTSKPITAYVSWQDQRSAHLLNGTKNAIESLELLRAQFHSITGMRLRTGLPIVNLATIINSNYLHEPYRFLTLVDWLLLRGGESNPKCHPTLAAGTGLYSLAQRDWSIDLLLAIGVDPKSLFLPSICSGDGPIGTIELGGKKIRVWGGLGDLQSAAHGLDFPDRAPILINLGTGSQVMAISQSPSVGIELRPSALGFLTHAVTHIPSGRALNTFAKFIDGCALQSGGSPLFWRLFREMQTDSVLAAEASIDLNVFSAAWQYKNGGSILKVLEGKFELSWLMHSLAKSWLVQYAQALQAICPNHPSSSFLLGGGLSRRGPFIVPALESLIGKRAIQVSHITGEETLDGLVKLALASH